VTPLQRTTDEWCLWKLNVYLQSYETCKYTAWKKYDLWMLQQVVHFSFSPCMLHVISSIFIYCSYEYQYLWFTQW